MSNKVPNCHLLKTWPEYFSAIEDGSKNFEFRKDDRNYQVGDLLVIKEYYPSTDEFTGRWLFRLISFKLAGSNCEFSGLEPGYCILSLSPGDCFEAVSIYYKYYHSIDLLTAASS